MTKIMLVEDDKSLREIYGVRLLAEGYDIVSAGDGEEALAMAIKERPGLIISDVMMPKVSGYDMLDILRSTTETKDIKVIMMTALSSDEQRNRAESLGADRYLVKSQVGIEDVVRVVHEVLADTPGAATTSTPVATANSAPATSPAPAPTPQPQAMPAPHLPPSPIQNTPAPAPTPTVPTPLPAPGAGNIPQPMMPKPAVPPKPASLKSRVIQPLNDPSLAPLNINELLDKELSKEAGLSEEERPVVASVDQAKAEMEAQLQSFAPPEPTPVTPPESITDPVPVPPSGPSILPTPGVAPVSTSPQANPLPTPPPMPQPPAMPAPHLPPSPIQNTPAPAPTPTPAVPTPSPAPTAPAPARPDISPSGSNASTDDGMSMPANIPTVEVPEIQNESSTESTEKPTSENPEQGTNSDVPTAPTPHPSTPTQLPQVAPPPMPQPTYPAAPTNNAGPLPSPTNPTLAQTRTLESPNAFTTNVPQPQQPAAPQLPEVPKV